MNQRAKTLITSALLALTILAAQSAGAADVRVESGSLAFLKQEKKVNLEFDYTGMQVGQKAKDVVSEPEFIARLNQKQPGRGDAWKREWVGSLPQYQQGFQDLLNRQLKGSELPLDFGAYKDAKYTLILKTTTLLTGTEGFAAAAPFVSADAIFVETANHTSVLAVVGLEKMPGGSGFYFAMREAYAKAGKELGIVLKKKAK